MDAKTYEWMRTRVDRARSLTRKIAELKDAREHFATGTSLLRVQCGNRRLFFDESAKRREALQEALAGILDTEIAEAQAELDAI